MRSSSKSNGAWEEEGEEEEEEERGREPLSHFPAIPVACSQP